MDAIERLRELAGFAGAWGINSHGARAILAHIDALTAELAAAKAERGQIVAWLRKPERNALIRMPDIVIAKWVDDDGFEWPERRRKISRLPTARDYADAIASGAHLEGEG